MSALKAGGNGNMSNQIWGAQRESAEGDCWGAF